MLWKSSFFIIYQWCLHINLFLISWRKWPKLIFAELMGLLQKCCREMFKEDDGDDEMLRQSRSCKSWCFVESCELRCGMSRLDSLFCVEFWSKHTNVGELAALKIEEKNNLGAFFKDFLHNFNHFYTIFCDFLYLILSSTKDILF